jgi:DNA invertase Pin-like site-specific DNA recombinase
MKKAVLYVRVSSKEQSEGYSLDVQEKHAITNYAVKNNLEVVKIWKVWESAWREERKAFNDMINFVKKHPEITDIIFDVPDRMTRNDIDKVKIYGLVKEFGKTIHFSRTGKIFSRNSSPDDEFMLDIEIAYAKKVSNDISVRTRMGLKEKAERGILPTRAPIGYKNNPLTGMIDIDQERAPFVRKIFELYATGNYSEKAIVEIINREGLRNSNGGKIHKSHIHRILKNPFYYGMFYWAGELKKGIHAPLISKELFDKVQEILKRCNKPFYTRRQFAFSGLLICGKCGCKITAEIKKERYIYYHCTGYRGKCGNIRIREEELDRLLGEVVKKIKIDEKIANWVEKSINKGSEKEREYIEKKLRVLNAQLTKINNRMKQAYKDKLDGLISEKFFKENMKEWEKEKEEIEKEIIECENLLKDIRVEDTKLILELAQNAYYLYSQQPPSEKRKLLNIILSNCVFDSGNLYPVFKKPFDILANFSLCSVRGE